MAGIAAASLFSGVFLAEGAKNPANSDPAAFSRLYFGLQPATNRDSERSVELIEELLEQGRAGEAAPLVAAHFASKNDHLDARGKSLKGRLLEAIAQCRPQDRNVLRSVLVGEQQRSLSLAHSPAELQRVIAAYPPEVFGGASLEALASAEADAGHYARAAAALRLAQQVSVANNTDADRVRLAQAEAVNRLRLGSTAPLNVLSEAEVATLSESFSTAVAASAAERAPVAWVSAGGDARRRGVAPGPAPSPWRRWRAPLGPASNHDGPSDGGDEAVSSGAVAANGVVVVSTPAGLIAVSAGTGQRLWTVDYASREPSWARSSFPLGLSTDTRLVFAVTPSAEREENLEATLKRRFGRSLFRGGESETSSNCLTAYELATGGKLRWRLDGGDAGGPTPSTRFLGPPAVAEGRLYALGESEQTLRLIEIDAETGRVTWSQPLVQSERSSGDHEGSIAISPTVGERLVYCPTGRGAVVAIDPLRRRLEWLGYLEVDDERAAPASRGMWGGMNDPRRWSGEDGGWRHCRAIVHGERLLVASPALSVLQVFDAATGRPLGSVNLEQACQLGGIVDGTALVVEREGVSAWRVSDLGARWKAMLPKGEHPAGEGLLLDEQFVLPLQSGKLATLDVKPRQARGEWRLVDLGINPLDQRPALGALLYHQGAILSHGSTTLESFQQPANPDSPEQQAVAALARGDDAAAVGLLRSAVAQAPTDRRLAELLAAALLRSSDNDPATAATAGDEVARLVAGRQAAASAAVLRLNTALARRNLAAVRREAESLAAIDAGGMVVQPEPGCSVAVSRLFADRAWRLGADHIEVRRIALADNSAPGPSLSSKHVPTAAKDDAWALRQVVASVETSDDVSVQDRSNRTFRQDRGTKSRRIDFQASDAAAPTDSPAGSLRWTLESRDGDWMLIGSNRRGERAAASSLPGDPWTGAPDNPNATVGAPGCRRWDDWLALKLETGFALYRPSHGFVWSSNTAAPPPWPAGSAAPDAQETPAAIGPWGVVSAAGSTLRCRDLATGELVWRRESDLAGEGALRVLTRDARLFVAGESGKGAVLSAWSGETIEPDWSPPAPKIWRACVGNHLLLEERSGRDFWIVPLKPREETELLWGKSIPLSSRFSTVGNLAVFFSEDRELTVLDIANAEERFTVTLPGPDTPPVRALRVRELNSDLLVEVDRANPMIDQARGLAPVGDEPLLTGELHLLDAATGEPRWARPVEVDGMAVIDTAAADAPVLLLARRKASESKEDKAEPHIAMVVLDLASGGTLYRNHGLPMGGEQDESSSLWAIYERAEADRLQIHVGRSWVTLQTTELPAPPRSPMLARVEDPEASRPNGPADIGRGVERLFKSLWEGDDD